MLLLRTEFWHNPGSCWQKKNKNENKNKHSLPRRCQKKRPLFSQKKLCKPSTNTAVAIRCPKVS